MFYDIFLSSVFLFSFIISLFIGILIIFKKNFFLNKNFENQYQPQKIHFDLTPRIGGACIFFGLTLQIIFQYDSNFQSIIFCILIGGPAFFVGLAEDWTRKISPIYRLLATLLSGILFVFFMDNRITSIDLYFVDELLVISYISVIFTILAIAVLSQAANIIDGLNGLSLGISLTIFTAYAFLANEYDDELIKFSCVVFAGLISGLFILNFPFGKIFLGDGGSYFIGVVCAIISIMLSERNLNISPFCIVLLLIFPLYETFRSIFRRIIFKTGGLFQPDSLHFHSLIYKYIIKNKQPIWLHNSISSMFILFLNSLFAFWAVVFHSEKQILIIGILLFILTIETIIFFLKRMTNNFNT